MMPDEAPPAAPISRLGCYQLGTLIGSGAMGDVYRARDTKLGRDVAIKILPARFTADPDRLARFDREARVLATLNHPHVAAIYGLEQAGDVRGLVLELVDGETLGEWIARRPSTPERLRAARQIADGLHAAHAKGIVHRDLKPANIKVTSSGSVKILDFGLAKDSAVEGAQGASHGTTVASNATGEGLILGTAAYMSPEQARGRPVDKRTDIWAFGCVLYEMLTERQAFTGETLTDLIVSLLEREPDWPLLEQRTGPTVARLVRRCLAKDPDRRLHDVADARLELDDALTVDPTVREARSTTTGRPWLWMLAGVLVASAGFVAWSYQRPPRASTPSSARFERLTDFVGIEESPALSPDAKAVAFVAPSGGRRHIWVRLLASGSPVQITRDDTDHVQPRWTPDSSSVVYFSPSPKTGEQGTLWEVPMMGGAPRRLGSSLSGGDVSHDGQRIAAFQVHEGRTWLAVMARHGSTVDRLIELESDSSGRNPRWSPDDGWIAFNDAIFVGFDDGVSVVRAGGTERRRIVHGGSMDGVAWLPDGTGVIYSSSSGSTVLYPPIFNLRVIRTDGAGDGPITFGDVSYTEPDVSRAGRVVARRTRIQSDIWRFAIDGSPEASTRQAVRVTHQTGQVQVPSTSPTGREIVYLSDSGGHGNLWIVGTDGAGTARQITFERDPAIVIGAPVWSRDGSRIVFIRTNAGLTEEWLVEPDGSNPRRLIERGVSASWSGDGQWLYYAIVRNGDSCIEKVAVDGGAPVSIRCSRVASPTVTADGSTMYFATRLTGAGRSGWDYEVMRARPETGPSTVLARISSARVPFDPKLMTPTLAPDGSALAMPLDDLGTSNVWILPTDGGPLRQITDFGTRATLIVRQIAWSSDSRALFAAVADTEADIVLIDHVVR